MSKETITLDNFADFHGEVSGVEIQSNLPFESYVPSTEINVRLDRIAHAARIGHLGSLTFRRYSEQSSTHPGIDSVSDDGSASASFSASVSKAPRMDANTYIGKDVAPWTLKGQATIKLNLGHEDLDDINLREAQSWSKYLDGGVRSGLRSSACKKLLDKPGRRGFVTSIWAGIPIAQILLGDMTGGTVRYLADDAIFVGLAAAVSRWQARAPHPTGESTLIPALPLDRIGLIQAYTRTRKFIDVK